MSSFGSFSGFGQSNNQNTGGFGGASNNSNNSALGSGFGSSSTNNNPFGGAQSSGGFGSGGTFGQNAGTSSMFGQSKPAFGAASSSGPSLFGNTATAGAGGFGTTSSPFGGNAANTTNTNSFGAASSGGGFSFGQSKPAFAGGASNSLFAGAGGASGTSNTSGFGGAQSNPFGQAGAGTALGAAVPPAEGTAVTPFNPTNEKDPTGSGTNSFQSINFMPAYAKYSFEELRLADYDKGRRFGNGSGQAGGFGTTGFGGGGFGGGGSGGGNSTFGAQSNTSFGGNATPSAFGGASSSGPAFGTNTTSGFGTGGGSSGLFGASNTQATGLFGAQPSAASSGGFGGAGGGTGFGSAGSGGFGATAGTSNTFGSNSAQDKPSLFGSVPGGGGTSNGAFGAAGGQLGQSSLGTNSNAFGGFGAQNQQGQDQSKAGGLFRGGAFGTAQTSQPQASSAFGAAPASGSGGGFFGGAAGTAAPGSTAFGGATQGSGGAGGAGGTGLFGGPASQPQKPSLFGDGGAGFGSSPNSNAGGGLFGNAGGTNPQQPGGSLFGAAPNTSGGLFNNQQQQPKPGLFGMNPQNTAASGTSLFGGQSANPMLNSTQQNQPSSQQGQVLHSSLLDGNPFGQSSIWSGLPEATPQNTGPLVTPLSTSQRLKDSQMKATPTYLLSSTSLHTPSGRRQGYGFSYSTYASPRSAASTPTIGSMSSGGGAYGRSFTGGSFGRSMAKSYSASNLRQQFNADGEGVLSPGAFAPGSSRYSNASIRRLTVDRNLKTDLFSRPSPALTALPSSSEDHMNGVQDGDAPNGHAADDQLNKYKKRVSFDRDATGGNPDETPNDMNGALVRTEVDGEVEPTAEEQGYLRSSRRGKTTNGTSNAPVTAEQGRGKELAVVPEDRESENAASKMPPLTDAPAAIDAKPGEYWMKPSRAELSKMSRQQLQHFAGLQVGRQGCGDVTFDDEVDLTTIRLDDLFEKIIEIRIRSITVYPDASTKPPPGKGLNVPSTLRLENSWPRARGRPTSQTSGPLFNKHIVRLERMENTEFVSYDTQTGVWTFTVEHYTRYGLDYDEEGIDEEDINNEDPEKEDAHDTTIMDLSDDDVGPEQTPGNETTSEMLVDRDENASTESSPVEDTFEFKKGRVPGSWGRSSAFDFDDVNPPGGRAIDEVSSPDRLETSAEAALEDDGMAMAGAFPPPGGTEQAAETPSKPVMKTNHRPWDTPSKPLIDLDGDWTEQLRRTVSPRKQNREALREVQSKVLLDRSIYFGTTKQQIAGGKNEIKTNVDLMNSLFGQHEERMAKSRMQGVEGNGIECPYPKRAKTFNADADSQMSRSDQQWHQSFPIKWTPAGSLLYARAGTTPSRKEQAWTWRDERLNVGWPRDVWTSCLIGDGRQSYRNSEWGWYNAKITLTDGVPFAKQKPMKFATYCEQIAERDQEERQTAASRLEMDVYRLAHVLFDKYDDHFSRGLNPSQKNRYAGRIRRDRLSEFWAALVHSRRPELLQQRGEGAVKEEKIIGLLSGHLISDACRHLTDLGSPRLSTMIAQLEDADEQLQVDAAEQLQAWRDQNIVSEMSEPIRALYELLAGNTTVSSGKLQGPFENRASTFSISQRFELDWIQAFGLCLWYGQAKNGDIEDVVRDFAGKLAKDEESARPHPDGMTDGQHQHPLWVLLQLYAATKGSEEDAPILPSALTPLAHHFDNRITFQLHHALTSNIPSLPVDTELADKLAVDLAFQLSASSFHLGAVFALMHLSDPHMREWHIRDLLVRYAASLPKLLDLNAVLADGQWNILLVQLKIPRGWICGAKAIHHRAQHQSLWELKSLLVAEEWAEAHDCFCRRVAPRAILEEDWAVIREMIGRFEAQIKEHVPQWPRGGGMYADFVALIDPPGSHGQEVDDARKRPEPEGEEQRTVRIKRLRSALAEVGREFKKRGSHLTAGGDVDELEQRAACHEMARMLADLMATERMTASKSKAMLLELPLTADARLRHAQSMALDHYRAVMATATAH